MLLSSVLCWGKSREIVWNDPIHGAANDNLTTFHKILFTDSATIVDFDVKSHNYRLLSKTKLITDNDTELKFLRLEGGPVNKRIEKPGRYQMYFAPAPKGCRWVHFHEGNGSTDWRVSYIRDRKVRIVSEMPAEWKNIDYDHDESLPMARYDSDSATITFQLLGYETRMNTSSITYRYHAFDNKNFSQEGDIELDSTGIATLQLPVKVLTRLSLDGGIRRMNLVINPGDRISCLIDMTDSERDIEFKGAHATLHHEMTGKEYAMLEHQISEYAPFAKVADCSTDEERIHALNEGLNTCKDLIAKSRLSNASKTMLRLEAEQTYWKIVTRYPIFLHTIQGLNLDRAAYREFIEKHRNTFNDSISKILATSQSFEMLSAPYAPIIGESFFYNLNHLIDTGAEILPYNRDLYHAFNLIQKGLTSDEIPGNLIQDPTLIEAVKQSIARQKELETALRQDDAIYYHRLDSIAPDEILPYILNLYKGQAFMIDLWATWCIPCRLGHKSMASLKEQLKDKPIKFVYIVGENSVTEAWKKMIDHIPGDHFYLTFAQQNAILKVLNSNTIPTYAIYDAQGNLTFKQSGFPGNKTIMEQINKAIGE